MLELYKFYILFMRRLREKEEQWMAFSEKLVKEESHQEKETDQKDLLGGY